jgi:hypothetical protein
MRKWNINDRNNPRDIGATDSRVRNISCGLVES